MARNRKRAKDRRPTQPVGARPVDRARGSAGDGELDPLIRAGGPGDPALPEDPEAVTDPLAHAAPDAELAAAQLAMGAPDDDELPDEEELDELATGTGPEPGAPRTGQGGNGGGGRSGELAVPGGARPERRPSVGSRLLTFLQGSWAELQRVQWPDRRQVMQATGVVIGFVIVAGVFLGVADTIAAHLMDWVLK